MIKKYKPKYKQQQQQQQSTIESPFGLSVHNHSCLKDEALRRLSKPKGIAMSDLTKSKIIEGKGRSCAMSSTSSPKKRKMSFNAPRRRGIPINNEEHEDFKTNDDANDVNGDDSEYEYIIVKQRKKSSSNATMTTQEGFTSNKKTYQSTLTPSSSTKQFSSQKHTTPSSSTSYINSFNITSTSNSKHLPINSKPRKSDTNLKLCNQPFPFKLQTPQENLRPSNHFRKNQHSQIDHDDLQKKISLTNVNQKPPLPHKPLNRNYCPIRINTRATSETVQSEGRMKNAMQSRSIGDYYTADAPEYVYALSDNRDENRKNGGCCTMIRK